MRRSQFSPAATLRGRGGGTERTIVEGNGERAFFKADPGLSLETAKPIPTAELRNLERSLEIRSHNHALIHEFEEAITKIASTRACASKRDVCTTVTRGAQYLHGPHFDVCCFGKKKLVIGSCGDRPGWTILLAPHTKSMLRAARSPRRGDFSCRMSRSENFVKVRPIPAARPRCGGDDRIC
jgi:hypothetical protein